MSENKKQLVIIGAGPGGYAAAFHAAYHGMDAALIDPEANPGGVCLYRGCIPSKALLHVARLINETQESADWGVKFTKPKIDLDKLRDWKDGVVKKLTGGLGQLSKQHKIEYIQGKASFNDSKSLKIEKNDGKEETIEFENVIIAAGSRPTVIPALDIDSDRVMNSSGALALPDIPKKLLVIGGGYIGLELGTVYSALGTDVTVVEMLPNLLPGADKDMVAILARSLKSKFENIMLKTTVKEMKELKTGIKVKFEGENLKKEEETFDRVLLSVGRKPNTEGYGLDNTHVKVNDKGFIEVNPKRMTNEPHIYAIGDVAGEPMLAHKASHEAKIAVEAIAGKKVAFEPRAIPAVVFTDPEVAWCGLTETEAKEKEIDHKVFKFPWGASGRATTIGRNDGVTKLIVDPGTERILGAGIAGASAGELIAEGVLAMEMGAVAEDLSLTIHAHPTLSETIMETAEMVYGLSTHVYKPKK